MSKCAYSSSGKFELIERPRKLDCGGNVVAGSARIGEIEPTAFVPRYGSKGLVTGNTSGNAACGEGIGY